MNDFLLVSGHRFTGCGRTRNAHVSMEERALQGRVKHMESMRALTAVVLCGVPTDFFRSLFSDATRAVESVRPLPSAFAGYNDFFSKLRTETSGEMRGWSVQAPAEVPLAVSPMMDFRCASRINAAGGESAILIPEAASTKQLFCKLIGGLHGGGP